jgi:hypothetical protein
MKTHPHWDKLVLMIKRKGSKLKIEIISHAFSMQSKKLLSKQNFVLFYFS